MTPERRAELREHVREFGGGISSKESIECLTEIDRLTVENSRLTKVVDQAIGWIDEGDHFIIIDSGNYPQLAAELEVRNR